MGQLLPNIYSSDSSSMDDWCISRSKRKMIKITCPGCGKILYEPDLKRRRTSTEKDNADDDCCNSVFTMGTGHFGQLGLGPDVTKQAMPTIVSNLPNDVIQVAAGAAHTVCLTEDGQVYSFGVNEDGALGRKTAEDEEEFFVTVAVEICAQVVQVSAGNTHTAALTEDGRVFIWGTFRDLDGHQCLIHNGPRQSTDPIEVMIDDFVIKVSSGRDHVVCLTEGGDVYTFGRNDQGQVGRIMSPSNDEDNSPCSSMLLVPERVCFPEELLPFHNIWTGPFQTYAKSATGDIYAWGLNTFCQLGFGDWKSRYLPEKWPEMSEDTEWMEIAVGLNHLLALDSRGRVYSVGRGVYGQLGVGRLEGEAETQTLGLIPKLQNKECDSIACGSYGSFAVTKDGTVYSWGMECGQLGLGDLNGCDVYVPTPIGGDLQTRKVLSVSSGGLHTLIVADEPMSKLKCDVDGHISRI